MSAIETGLNRLWICAIIIVAIAYVVGLAIAYQRAPEKFWIWPLTIVVLFAVGWLSRRVAGLTSVDRLATTVYAHFPPQNARIRAWIAVNFSRLFIPLAVLGLLYYCVLSGRY